MKWKVTIWWTEDLGETAGDAHIFEAYDDMLAHLDNEAFCPRHDCPIPFRVVIEQVS